MARGMGGHSPSNVTHHLKGIHFPADKQALVEQAKQNKAPPEVMEEIEAMEDQEFGSIAEVMKAFGKEHRDSADE
jgi:predicted transcriptional regulator